MPQPGKIYLRNVFNKSTQRILLSFIDYLYFTHTM